MRRHLAILFALLGSFTLVASQPRDLQEFYSANERELKRCARQVFGLHAGALPSASLRYESRPAIDFSRDRQQLSTLRARWSGGRPIDGIPVPPPWGGDFGTVLIVRDYLDRNDLENLLRTYIHELGNLLDYALYPDIDDPRLMRHFGDPEDPLGDDDTGQQFERCMAEHGAFDGLTLPQPSPGKRTVRDASAAGFVVSRDAS